MRFLRYMTWFSCLLAGVVFLPLWVALAINPASQEWFQQVDWNKDQQLTYGEVDSECLQRFNRLDGDQNNQLSLAEISTFLEFYTKADKKQLQTLIQQRFTLIDANQNQQISRGECLNFNRQLMGGCDADHNGVLTYAEWETCVDKRE